MSEPKNTNDSQMVNDLIVYRKGIPTGFIKPDVSDAFAQDGNLRVHICFKIATRLNHIWKKYYVDKDNVVLYDPQVALDASFHKDSYYHPDSGELKTCPLEDEIPEGTPRLSQPEITSRIEQFVRLAIECVQEKYLEKILSSAIKKKNGSLHKGRVLQLAYLNCVGQDGITCSLVAVNQSDDEILVELRTKTPVTQTYIEQEFLFMEPSPRIVSKKLLKEKQEEKYLLYKKLMEETINRQFDEYVQDCKVTSKNLLKSIVTDEEIVFKEKCFAVSTYFSFRKEICEEIVKRGGKIEGSIANKKTDYYVADLRHINAEEALMARVLQREVKTLKTISDYQLWTALIKTDRVRP